jgi:hypothetical protein
VVLNSGLCTCKAGALPLEPHFWSILLWLFWMWGSVPSSEMGVGGVEMSLGYDQATLKEITLNLRILEVGIGSHQHMLL